MRNGREPILQGICFRIEGIDMIPDLQKDIIDALVLDMPKPMQMMGHNAFNKSTIVVDHKIQGILILLFQLLNNILMCDFHAAD